MSIQVPPNKMQLETQRDYWKKRARKAEQHRDELLEENKWLVATIGWLSSPENNGGITTCRNHNGYVFRSDCVICQRLNAIAKARGQHG